MSEQLATIIYNPIKVNRAELEVAVQAEPASADWTVNWLETSGNDPGQGPAKRAIDSGSNLVIAVGGDGTVRAVAEMLRGTDIHLALLPSGTGNLLARNLKLTLDDTANSLATAFSGTERAIDAAGIEIRRANGAVDRAAFLVMAGAGLDAKIMSNTDPELKKKVGWLAYAQALVAALRDKDVLRLQYKVDSRRTKSERAQAIVVGNCGSLPANILLFPDAVVDDGLLDVILLKPETIRGWIAVIVKVFWENGVIKRTRFGQRMTDLKSNSLDMHQGKAVTVRLNRPEEIELDGDSFGEMVGFRITVEPGALMIKVPRA